MKKKIFLSLLMIIFAIFTAACGDQQKEKDNVSQGENQNESQNDSSDGESQASSFYDNSLFYGDSILKGLSNNLDNGHVISSSGGTTQFAMENVNKIVDQAPGGFLGVGVFFVLSGYLITDILMRQWKNKGKIDLKDFWLRRARRLLPGLFLLLIVVGGWMIVFHFSRFVDIWGHWLASFLYVSNWWYIGTDVGYFAQFSEPTPLLHLWSLAVEEQFYVFWPFFLILGITFMPKRKWLIGTIVLLAFASALNMALLHQPGLMDTSRVYYGTDTRAFSLLIGAALALCLPSHKLTGHIANYKPLRFALDIVGIAGVMCLIWMFGQVNQYETFLYRGGMVIQCIATTAIIAAAVHPSTWIGRMLGFRPLRWLGVRSYGIYIWHYPILVLTFSATAAENLSILQIIIQLAAVLVIAAVSWRFVEKPIRYKVNKGIGKTNRRSKDVSGSIGG